MPEPVNSVLVVVASPGDAAEERAAVRESLNDWSIKHGRRQGVVLMPWLYERHAVPAMGGRPQALINAQAVDQADIVVAFFDSRLGSSTGVDVSGTAEEIRRAVGAGKPVHVYFSTEPLPREADLDQLAALRAFKGELQQAGLLGEYSDPADLAGQIEYAVQHDITEHGWAGQLASTSRVGAQLRWSHRQERELTGTDRNGKAKYRTRVNDLIVVNESSVAAEDLTFTVKSLAGEEGLFHFDGPDGPVTVHPRSEMQWLLIPIQGAGTVKIDGRWTEGGIPCVGEWTVATR
ncbi:DUF4062 domain-containing protein [Kribbella sp. DT2]|uniref:DUF4062 domain-containing protein n=1 Tax=Kribbella sp. DT2 TaxID=3393427 RepID=UPI003CF0B08F